MRYLSKQEVIYIHDCVIEATGGSHGVRDERLLESICEKPKTAVFGQEQYGTVWEKAAATVESFAKYHVFVDGNKRIAMAAAARFLYVNGYVLAPRNAELEDFAVMVVEKDLSVKDIAAWLEKYSEKV